MRGFFCIFQCPCFFILLGNLVNDSDELFHQPTPDKCFELQAANNSIKYAVFWNTQTKITLERKVKTGIFVSG